MNDGTKNLNTFKILFIIKGVFACFGMLIFMIYATMGQYMGQMMKNDPQFKRSGIDPSNLITMIGIVGMIFFISMAVLAFVAAKKLSDRKGQTIIIVAAVVNLFSGLLGLLLCIFTLIEMFKPEVKAVFEGAEPTNNPGVKYTSNTEEIL